MIKHPDTDVQFIIEVLEGQRDSATVQSAAFFQENLKLKQEIEDLKSKLNDLQQTSVFQEELAKT